MVLQDAKGDFRRKVEARPDGGTAQQVVEEQGSRGEDDEGHGDLGNDQGAAHAEAALAVHGRGERFADCLPGGHEAAGERGEDGEGGRVTHHPPVRGDLQTDGHRQG